MPFEEIKSFWKLYPDVKPQTFECGYCLKQVASSVAFVLGYSRPRAGLADEFVSENKVVLICPSCQGPNYFDVDKQFPSPAPLFGSDVDKLPIDVAAVYSEMRKCHAAGCFTAVVLLSRKLIMHIAVDAEAKERDNFAEYVNFLERKGLISPKTKKRADKIRELSNEANHQIVIREQEDAELCIDFLAMVLKNNYEYADDEAPETP
jgi:hypothetical protein